MHILFLIHNQQMLVVFKFHLSLGWALCTAILLFLSKAPKHMNQGMTCHEWIITKHMNTESSHIVMQCCPLIRQVGKQGPEKDGLITRLFQRWLEPDVITSSPYFYLSNNCPLFSFYIPTDATWDQAHPSHLNSCSSPDCSICSTASPNTSSSASTWLPRWSSTMQIGSWFLKSFRCSHHMGDRVHTPSQDPHGREGSDPWCPSLPLISLPLSPGSRVCTNPSLHCYTT